MVEAVEVDGEFTVEKTGEAGTISTTKSEAAFTNTRTTGELEISKALVSDATADADREFTFTIELSDKSISKTYGDMAFAGGVATVTLKGGESATATGLPTGISYAVTEEAADGFTVTKTGDAGTISTTRSLASFTNTRETGDLELSKALVSDAAADADQQFTCTVTLDGLTGEAKNKTYSGVAFTEDRKSVV